MMIDRVLMARSWAANASAPRRGKRMRCTERRIDELLTGNVGERDPGIGNSRQSLTRFRLEGRDIVRKQSWRFLQIGRYRHVLGELSIDAGRHRAGRKRRLVCCNSMEDLARLAMTAMNQEIER